MMRKSRILLALFLIISVITLKSQKVIEVQDGDTFLLEDGSKVRMIGVNAPEKKDIYGIESKNHLENLILYKEVVLKNDDISSNFDRYQRQLRYVYIDGVDINRKMIEDGYAFAYLTYNFTKSDEYKSSQLKSKKIENGMWGDGQIKEIMEEQITTKRRFPKRAIVLGFAILLILAICGITLIKK